MFIGNSIHKQYAIQKLFEPFPDIPDSLKRYLASKPYLASCPGSGLASLIFALFALNVDNCCGFRGSEQ